MGYYDGPKIVTDGLVLSLDAADRNSYPGSGTTVNDLSQNMYSGVLISGVTYNNENGGSFVFERTDDYIDFSDDDTSQSNTQLSVCSWVKDTHPITSGNRIIAVKFGYYQFRCNTTTGNLTAFVDIGGSLEPRIGASFTKNVWNHAAFTWNTNGNFRLFINGNVVASSTTRTGTLTATSNTGTLISEPNNEWAGNIAVVQVYGRTLTDAEILQNYNATKSRFGL